MRNINILINEDHTVSFNNDYAGLNRENLQGNIVFSFKNFVDGQARAEVIIDGEDGYILLEKVGETYTMPIRSSLLTSDFIIMQLVIDEPGEDYPVWKSEAFTLKVGYSINATSTIPEDYPSWVQILDELRTETEDAITKAENVNISSEQLTDGVKVITTNQDGEQTITIVPQGPQGEPGVPGAIKMLIVAELPSTGADDTIYLVPLETPDVQGNNYAEYVYINGAWELLGKIGVQFDLTNYVQFTDYATSSKGGVFKTSNGLGTQIYSADGILRGTTRTFEQYSSDGNTLFISKGTLENVITGKGLVSNTNYATRQVGGVIKYGNYMSIDGNGTAFVETLTNTQYENSTNSIFIGKGTLENVLTNRIGNIQTLLDDLDSGGGVE